MRQTYESTSTDEPYLSFELFSRTPLPPDLAKTRKFPRDPDPETTRFVRQVVDDTVPFSTFEGAELAIMAAPAPAVSTVAPSRRTEDDSLEIEIVDASGSEIEIAQISPIEEPDAGQSVDLAFDRIVSISDDGVELSSVAALPGGEPPDIAFASEPSVAFERTASSTAELDEAALEPFESSLLLPIAVDEPIESSFLMPIAEPIEIAPAVPVIRSNAFAWRPFAIALFLAAAFACGIGAAFALT